MFLDGVACLIAQAVEEGNQVAALELNRRPATPADNVVPVSAVGGRIAMATILAVDTPHKTLFGQQIQGAVDCHQPNAGAVGPGAFVNFCCARWAFILEQGPDDRPPRLGDPVASLAQLP